MRVYRIDDGVSALIVAAPNQREACRLLGCTLYFYRQYGGECARPEAIAVALQRPGQVWRRRLFGIGKNDGWQPLED